MELVKQNNWLSKLQALPKISEYADGAKDIAVTIGFAARYYGIKEPDNDVLKILALDIVDSYPDLRKDELMEAFKLASKQKIDVSLDLYGRPMNAWLVHQIVRAYMIWRGKQARQLREQEKFKDDSRNIAQCPPEISKKFDELKRKYSIKEK